MNTRLSSKVLSLFLSAVLLLAILPISARATDAVWDGTTSQPSGSGTSTSHYIISTAEELAWFADKVNASTNTLYYADLAADIVLNDTENLTSWAETPPANTWTPIGSSVNTNRIVFDGCGWTISGLYINSTGDYKGLFGYIGKNASGFASTVKNLTLEASYIKGAQYVGGICGYLYQSNEMSGCKSSATVVGTGSYTGGIAGYVYNLASVSACHNAGTVSGTMYVGGVTGSLGTNANIANCGNTGTVNATADYAGGFAGYNGGTIKNAYNTAYVNGKNYNGGVCGYNTGSVSYVYNVGSVTGTAYIGKVCGWNIVGASITSAWFLGSSTESGVGINYGNLDTTSASADQFASGAVAYLLGAAFGQDLDTDASPVLRTADNSNAVYKLTYLVETAEYAIQYYNAGDTISTAGITTPTMTGGYFTGWQDLPATMPASDLSVTASFLEGASPAPHITTDSLPDGYIDVEYSAAVSATGQTPITFSLADGTSLPSGLNLDASTGVISGTPAALGTTIFTIQASGTGGDPDTHTYSVTIADPKPVITTTALPEGYKGEAYSTFITATGPGTITYEVSADTPLPDGLTLNTATGEIIGTPANTGSSTIKFTAANAYGSDEATLTLSVHIFMVGTGTQSDPYQISTSDQMYAFAAIVNETPTKFYYATLMNDIALNNVSEWESWASEAPANEWTPIGSFSSPFRGVFNGNNKTISGVYVNSSNNYAGFFGCIAYANTTITDLTLSQSYIKGAAYVGGICGYLAGNATTSIENCASSATVAGTSYVGGICGYIISGAVVNYCQNSGLVTGTSFTGGIAGQNYGKIDLCQNSGTVASTTVQTMGGAFGGICGHNYGAVTNSYNQGTVACPSCNSVGGICGINNTATNVYNTGSVIGNASTTGKICGTAVSSSVLTGCYFMGASTDAGIGANNGPGSVTAKSAAQFASGEVAYLLGSTFGQELGTNADAYPVFRTADDGNAVYKLTYQVETAEYAAQYYNDGDVVSASGIVEPAKNGCRFSHWQDLPAAMPDADVTVSAVYLTVSAAIDPTENTFPAAKAGYAQQTAQQFTVTNTGESGLTGLSASLTGGAASGFEISAALSGTSLGTDSGANTATVSVRPKIGLGPGTYTDTLIVSGDYGISLSTGLSFSVDADTRSDAKAITAFSIGEAAGVIDEASHTIAVTVPFGTDVTSLIPSITVSDKATVDPASGTALDFSSPVTYTVTAENETEQDYTVTVSVEADTRSDAKAITAFSIGEAAGVIDEASHTIAVTVPFCTDVTSLIPSITVSDGAAVAPASGTAQDFSSPVIYTVTAENETDQDYMVTVSVASASAHIVTVKGSYAVVSGAGSYNEGETVFINAGSRSGYTFAGWRSNDSVAFADASSPETSFSMPDGDITVTARWTYSGASYNDAYPVVTATKKYAITVKAGVGGTITPSGSVNVKKNGDKTFTIIADEGYEIADVLVDGKSIGPVSFYTFEDVESTHTIKAVFKKKQVEIELKPESETVNPFADVSESDWFYESVMEVYEKGLMSGMGEGRFEPDGATTRAMLVTILWRLSGNPEADTAADFSDVNAGTWYFDAISWAEASGIVIGVGNNMFAPEAVITREQLAVMLYNYAKYMNYNVSARADTNILFYNGALSVSDYACAALQWACGAGVINGDGNGNLNPGGSATRAAVAVMLARFVKSVAS